MKCGMNYIIYLWRGRKVAGDWLFAAECVKLRYECRGEVIAKTPIIALRCSTHIEAWRGWLSGFVDRAHPPLCVTTVKGIDVELHELGLGEIGHTSQRYFHFLRKTP
jgi:hypothetical protein